MTGGTAMLLISGMIVLALIGLVYVSRRHRGFPSEEEQQRRRDAAERSYF